MRQLLYVGIALILRNVWVWLRRTVLARPRAGSREIRLDLLRFRRMLLWLAHVVERSSASATPSRSNCVNDQGLRPLMTTPSIWND